MVGARLRLARRSWAHRRRTAAAARSEAPDIAFEGEVTIAVCHPDGGLMSPPIRTVLRNAKGDALCEDVEIRGFLDGTHKFKRNVATQYHVRIGCEGTWPKEGRYEIMRVLMRWKVGAIPPYAAIEHARLVLHQEDLRQFPHAVPVRPTLNAYAFAVKRAFRPGRGGVGQDNQSEPEPGDAWWGEARADQEPWRLPGCGYGSDTDSDADREAHPLARARLVDSTSPLVFEGPRLTAAVAAAVARNGDLDLLIRAGERDELHPGSVRAFYSAEFGDDVDPSRRPSLEVTWRAAAVSAETRPYVLEPMQTLRLHQDPAPGSVLAASVSPAPGTHAPALALAGPIGSSGSPLTTPRCVSEGPIAVDVIGAVNPIPAGTPVRIELLETWHPAAPQPQDLPIDVRLHSPSGREFALSARFERDATYACVFEADEPGVWSYAWRTQPDRNYAAQANRGMFTVVCDPCAAATRDALLQWGRAEVDRARQPLSALGRDRCRLRLGALEVELRRLPEASDPETEAARLLAAVGRSYSRVA